ncbi:hypothetical protein [Rubritepida flocculans]|uniref:hypothetical protein n=1 Tax=Rubritepida flocculans TaxID=182403 RepID=UPI0012EC8136|nr:hypothetical protein [Rubritepida flocculans]
MRWRAGLGLAALLMAGVALAQPSTKLHLTPPGAQPATPPKGGPQAAPAQPPAPAPAPPQQAAPAWPPLPPRLAQEPPALERLRGLLDAGIELGYRAAGQEGELLTLTGVELRRGAERILIERLVLEGLSPEGLRRGEARGVSAEFPDARFRLAELDLEALALLPLRPGQNGGAREPDQISLAGLRLAGLEVEGEPRVSLREFVLTGWQPGRAGRVGFQGLRVRLAGGPVSEVGVDRAGVEGLDLAALAQAAVRNAPPPAPPAGRQAYRVDGVTVQREGRVLGGLGSVVVEGRTEPDGAAAGRLTVHDAALEHFPEVAAALDAVGLRRLSMELAIEASWTPRHGRLEMPALAFGVRELGAIALGWVMEGVDPAAAMTDPNRVSLIEARLRYADQSLYERALRDQAQRERSTPERIRQQHAQMVGAMLTPARPDPEVDAVRNALLRFIGGQAREIEISLRPARAVTMAELQPLLGAGPSEVVRGLGITATAR